VAAIGAHGHKTDRVFACGAVERGLEVQYGKFKEVGTISNSVSNHRIIAFIAFCF
jgi:hypothetical protein